MTIYKILSFLWEILLCILARMKTFVEGGFVEGPMISEIELLKQSICQQQEFAKIKRLETEGHEEEFAWSGYYSGLEWVLNEIEMNRKLYTL